MEEPIVLSPLEELLLSYGDLARDQELLESLDYVTLMNLCQTSTSLRRMCQSPDIQALLKAKEQESAFIILRNLQFISDTEFRVDMIIQYPGLLRITIPRLEFTVGEPMIGENIIDSDIESLVNGEDFGRVSGYVDTKLRNSDYARYYPEDEIVLVFSGETSDTFEFNAQLYHRILVNLLELYDLEYAIGIEGGETGKQEIYIHV